MTQKEENKFYEYLASFQEDIHKLVAVKRRDGHLMTVDEIVSDFNFNTIRNKEKIIDYRDENFKDFSFESFKYVVCCHIKNIVSWYQCRKKNEKFVSRRNDFEIMTEEGKKSSFEMVEVTHGVESDFHFDDNDKHKYFLKLIKNYGNFLTKNEVELLDYLLKGHKQKDIAKFMGVTHQAISFNVIMLEEKLRCRVKDDYLKDESWDKIREGNNAIKKLFEHEKR